MAALADLGYPEVEEGKARPLYGYQGDRRPEAAELIVRRRHVGHTSNDFGIARTPQLETPILSDYDQRTLLGEQFLVRLRTAYSEPVVEEGGGEDVAIAEDARAASKAAQSQPTSSLLCRWRTRDCSWKV